MPKKKLREWDLMSPENIGFHEAADIFPGMGPDEFEAFKADVAENGLQTPIVTTPDGFILDGRHRWRACMETQTEPRYQIHQGNPWTYVMSANLHRRHLSESQRAMVGARVRTRLSGGDRRSRQFQNAGKPILITDGHVPPTQGDSAKQLNVAISSITKARRVLKDGVPELVAAVDEGTLKVETAHRVAALEDKAQLEFMRRIRNGEKPSQAAPPSNHHKGGNTRRVIKHPSIETFTRTNAENLMSALTGIELAFREVVEVDPAVTDQMSKTLQLQIRAVKAVLNRLAKLL